MAGPQPARRESRRVGLARCLSKLGFCSRTQAVRLIHEGCVTLNGTVRRDPEIPVNLAGDKIAVSGVRLAAGSRLYLMLNKPRGLVTTTSDEQGRNTVYSCLPEDLPWIAPVGRLDKASEGLLLFTNDSEWAARVLAPESHLDRTYHVQIAGAADPSFCKALIRGFQSADGYAFRMKQAHILRQGERNTWLEVVLDEGRNRHIRRMMEHMGREVLRLLRVSIGPLVLGDLHKGAFRPLTISEKESMDNVLKQKPKLSSLPRPRRAN